MTASSPTTRLRLLDTATVSGPREPRVTFWFGAAAAATLADYSVVTSDNPRGEDPSAIVSEITRGFGASNNFEVEVDREKAIAKALALARPGDTLLIAGKGHENVQEFENTVVPFDDRDVVRRQLNRV